MHKELLAQIAEYFSGEHFAEEFSEAKEDYFSEAGKIFEDDPDYERKISAFLEWYLLDRMLNKERETPAEHFAKNYTGDYNQVLLEQLIRSQRSLFNIKNIKKYILEDLLYQPGEPYPLAQKCIEEKMLMGLDKNQVVDARVFTYENTIYVTDTLLAHTQEASTYIKKELKKNHHLVRKNISTVLDFAYMAYRSKQFSHVDIKEIYSLEKIKTLRSEIKSAQKK